MTVGRIGLTLWLALLLAACAPATPPLSEGHIQPQIAAPKGSIPPPVMQAPPVLAKPVPKPKDETYTIVVSDVPVRELLFALAREARLNVDIHPGISGNVTLNAVNQTLPQILDRLSQQVDLRHELRGPNLLISPDTPVLRTYKVDYSSVARDTTGSVSVATQIASTGTDTGATQGGGGGSGNNNSTTQLTNTSVHRFWQSLTLNVLAILGDQAGLAEAAGSFSTNAGMRYTSQNVITNTETGLLSVRATARQHAQVQALLDQIMAAAHRQVLVEATVVEVQLNQQYQAGIDWANLALGSSGWSFSQAVTGTNLAAAPVFAATYSNPSTDGYNINVTLRALETFGKTRILSSPKTMALNNQTAILKVVDNRVYFTIDADITPATTTSPAIATFESNLHTVPVGFVMSVTPQISDNDSVIMNVRPTVSRILGYVQDPNPALQSAALTAPITNLIPEIQVREIESVLKVQSGQTAILGGLMQDSDRKDKDGLPGLSRGEGIGSDLFSFKDNQFQKTELVIFLKPTVVRNASVGADLAAFRGFLPDVKAENASNAAARDASPLPRR
jgi:general secretion pathway protein D